jgi:hypothetical protein
VAQADGSPDEEVGEAGQGQEPAEDGGAFISQANVSKEAKCELDDDTPDRTACLVDVGQEARSHTTLGHRLHSTGGTVRTGICHRDDGNCDDRVENGWKDLDASVLDGEHKRGGLGIRTRCADQTVVGRRQNQTEDEQVDNVEEGDAEEDLF